MGTDFLQHLKKILARAARADYIYIYIRAWLFRFQARVQICSADIKCYASLLSAPLFRCGIFEVKEGCEEVASVSKSGLPGFMSTVRRAPAARPMCFLLCFAELLTVLIHTNQSEVFFLSLKLLYRNVSRLSMINLRMSPQHEANMPLSIWITINRYV